MLVLAAPTETEPPSGTSGSMGRVTSRSSPSRSWMALTYCPLVSRRSTGSGGLYVTVAGGCATPASGVAAGGVASLQATARSGASASDQREAYVACKRDLRTAVEAAGQYTGL
jgi:hypothetical protein